MNAFVFPPPPVISLPIHGTDAAFPVRRIFCVGRNYAAHIQELHNETPEAPFYFTKQRDELVPGGGLLPYAPATKDLQFELEMVVAIGSPAFNVSAERAREHIFGYAVGLDMTRRDLQKQLQQARLPWAMGKSFDYAAPCGEVTPALVCGHLDSGRVALTVNGEIRQDGDLHHLIWDVPHLLSNLSQKVQLQPGDLLFTGTPAGVGPVQPGDRLHGEIEGLQPIDVEIAPPLA